MKALSTLRNSIDQTSVITSLTLISLVFWIFPQASLAASQVPAEQAQSALVFEIKSPKTETQGSLQYQTIVQNDPLVTKLQAYLNDKQSPLADNASQIVQYNNWKRAIAISFVESNMCRFTPKYSTKNGVGESHNCSGIGGQNFKRYTSYQDWFVDMNTLLEKPNYKTRPIEKFINYYVQPGSLNWLNGVRKTEADLNALEQSANQERVAMQSQGQLAIANIPPVDIMKLVNKE